jgi:glycerol-3-phosphate O-acyltransferase / dihydroxyacetone phosphate acyltransferase
MFMQTQISAGTIDAPSWDTVRVSKLATRMYAPLGTQMALSDFVRVWRVFADAFSGNKGMRQWKESQEPAAWSSSVSTRGDSGYTDTAEDAGGNETADEGTDEEEFLRQREELAKDLSVRYLPSPWCLMNTPPLSLIFFSNNLGVSRLPGSHRYQR